LSTIETKWIPYAGNIPTDTYILGSVLPSDELVKRIVELPAETALFWNQQWIAYRAASPTNAHKQIVYLENQPEYIQFPEDLLDANCSALPVEIKPNAVDPQSFSARGNTIIHPEKCYIDPSASLTGAILDASQGPIYIGKNVTIQIGTYIQGPAAILQDSVTNIGAKISASILFPYSNKSHEGFLGNSIIGSFCNLGALTTCSNVRNDLKHIHVYNYASRQPRNTGRKSFGILMGDYVCTGIHTKFNTGTLIGNHCNISGTQFHPFPHLGRVS
jgi:NDP-sugar pyrophosphorylase family protein